MQLWAVWEGFVTCVHIQGCATIDRSLVPRLFPRKYSGTRLTNSNRQAPANSFSWWFTSLHLSTPHPHDPRNEDTLTLDQKLVNGRHFVPWSLALHVCVVKHELWTLISHARARLQCRVPTVILQKKYQTIASDNKYTIWYNIQK